MPVLAHTSLPVSLRSLIDKQDPNTSQKLSDNRCHSAARGILVFFHCSERNQYHS